MERKDEILLQEEEEFLWLSSEEAEENELSYWEFINQSDADPVDHDIDELSLDSGFCVSGLSSVSSSAITIPQNAQFEATIDDVCVGFVKEEYVSYVGNQYHEDEDVSYVGNQYHEVEDEDEDNDHDLNDDYDDYGYDLDDELVPRSVSGKLGRQRMRKLGKRTFTKMNYSKKSPFLYVKPGAVHGKHGLGMKHSL